MNDYNVKDRIITKEDWEKWLKSKEEYSDKRISNMQETLTKKENKYAVIEWHKYPDEKPPKEGLYLITLKFGNTKDVSMGYLTKDIYSNTLTAWAEIPEPYNPEEDKND